MGSLEDDENRDGNYPEINKSNRIDGGDFKGEVADGFLCFTDTMPVEDTFLFENAFETQLVGLAGETQVMDFGGETHLAGETQVLDFGDETQLAGETQVLDFGDETQLAGETQVLDFGDETQLAGETQVMDFGDETHLAGETQVMDFGDETQVVDDFDYMKDMRNTELLNEPSAEDVDVSGSEGTNETEVLCDTQKVPRDDFVEVDSGDSVGRGNQVDSHGAYGAPSDVFVKEKHRSGSVCRGFTSIRAASIRASGLAARARGAKNNSCSINTSSMQQNTFKQDDSFLVDQAKCGTKNMYNENKEERRTRNTYKAGSRTIRKLHMEDELIEGKSEAEVNNMDDNINMPNLHVSGNCLAGLSYANSQEPGELSQANALEVVDKFLELNVMEYDQALESGIKAVEKPKVIAGAKGSRDLAKSSILRSSGGECGIYDWDNTREDEGGGDFFLKKKEHFFDKRSCTEPRKRKGVDDYVDEKGKFCNEKKLGVKKSKFSNDLNEQINMASGKKLLENDIIKDIPDVNNVGPDTQIAAEAMEILCLEVNLADSNINIQSENVQNTKRVTRKKQYSKSCDCLKDTLTEKMHCPVRGGVVTRQAKQMKGISVGACKDSSLPPIKPSKNVSKRKQANKCTEKTNGFHDIENPLHSTDLTVQRSEKKCRLQEQLGFSVPVAHRTRKCAELNHSKAAENPVDTNGNMNDLISGRVVRKKRTVRDKNAVIVTVEQLRKARSIKRVGTSSASHIDEMGHIKGKRTQQEKVARGQGDEGQCNVRLKSSKTVTENISLFEKEILPNCTPPATCSTPVKNPSPICVGDEYHKKSCRKSLSGSSLMKEVNNLISSSPEPKEARKRRDITNIRVLFSQHLDVDVIKKQKKILVGLGAGVASSMSDATHFIADEFVRTRNMLEAIALGKPIVTHLWLESCEQASCLIHEKNYILRDARKEKEFGFCMPVSLSRASQHPLLQGQKVLITQNTKPGQDILANLVKTVHGLAVERLGRSVLKEEKFPDDLLILSCEEDYDVCVPFLEKGASVYSSELLLNGIVIQKLEYERHRLFSDHVKRTRSTIWVKKKNQYLPVPKCK